MPRPIHKLTLTRLRSLPAEGKLSDGGNLFLQLKHGNASWILRYMVAGRERFMGLGALDANDLAGSLAEARRKAAEAREMLAKGIDPLADKRNPAPAVERVPTFRELAEGHIKQNWDVWKGEVHRRQWQTTLASYVYPRIGELPVDKITPDHVVAVLLPIWKDRHETASRVAQRIKVIIDIGIARRFRPIGSNPAHKDILRRLLPKVQRKVKSHPAVNHKWLPLYISFLQDRKDVKALALKFLILNASRSAEARKAEWAEFSLAERLWTLPGFRVKGGREHVVPLSRQSLEILETMKTYRHNRYVFPGPSGEPISEASLRGVLRTWGLKHADGTLHGMRSSFRDWAAENDVADRVAEAALAHVIENKVEAAYLRTRFLEKRREVLQRWADYLSDV